MAGDRYGTIKIAIQQQQHLLTGILLHLNIILSEWVNRRHTEDRGIHGDCDYTHTHLCIYIRTLLSTPQTCNHATWAWMQFYHQRMYTTTPSRVFVILCMYVFVFKCYRSRESFRVFDESACYFSIFLRTLSSSVTRVIFFSFKNVCWSGKGWTFFFFFC